MSKHTCRWILIPNTPLNEGKYCGDSVSFKMKIDDDGNRYRKYFTFCDIHQKMVDALDAIDDEFDQ